MADPRETAHDLRLAAQAVYAEAAGRINEQYRQLKLERKRQFDLEYDQVRNELAAARLGDIDPADPERNRTLPRDEARVQALQSRLGELKRRPPPDTCPTSKSSACWPSLVTMKYSGEGWPICTPA